MAHPRILVVVLAHNEERRIAACLDSLPLERDGVEVHVVVNGSTDRTAQIARGFAARGVVVHEYERGGKARSWNRFVMDEAGEADSFVFVDGDARVSPGAIDALVRALDENPAANAASGLPHNGRSGAAYRAEMMQDHGLFGDLYALRGGFVARMRASGVRLPDDVIGDDSLVAALAKTDLDHEDNWQNARVVPCPQAGFFCEPTRLTPRALRAQARRMVNYAQRHFQNRIISDIMRGPGPQGLPGSLVPLYRDWLPHFSPRPHPVWWWFDRQALRRMAASARDL